ncbi:DUF1893 domain-containing protein [Anaerobranca gottschalkii]|uniref:DUF1893 domain-containing protein n=1 Tax=Anaerobranca gottschalkii DSM 13577 TaxID=1120990 RepID=A0A1I0AKT1_9FIRM|nr:DUF1893 domain-containing protein [Anaerobranca gottschalkii]SES94910.1 protein of unknown function [Anaerobranca gottschalkii DSM 13577]
MEDLQLAKKEFEKGEYSLILVKNGEVVGTSKEKGVKGILEFYLNHKELLEGAAVADKLVGRAVAMICQQGKVKGLYTPLLSEGGEEILRQGNIPYQADRIVKAIKNRDNTDLCPIEKLTLGVKDSRQGINKILEFFQNLPK